MFKVIDKESKEIFTVYAVSGTMFLMYIDGTWVWTQMERYRPIPDVLVKHIAKYNREKRSQGVSFEKLAKEYGVCKKTIQDAVSGKNWAYLTKPPKGE